MRRGVSLASLVVVLAVVAAGCGGDDGAKQGYALSKQEYANALNAICKDVGAKIEELVQGSGTLKETLAEHGEELEQQFRDANERVQDLTPPDEVEDAAERFVEIGEEQADLVAEATAAAKDDDDEAFTAATTKLDEADDENDKVADEIGASDCGST